MKRKGYLYDKTFDSETLEEAEIKCLKHKKKSFGVRTHNAHRVTNLLEIQSRLSNKTFKTGEYRYEDKRSGQNKIRHIAKLKFHPNHIEQQSVVMVVDEVLNKSYIPTSFASRTGYGPVAAALYVSKWIRCHPDHIYYGQFDIVKYYDSIRHEEIRNNLGRRIKDKDIINAFMEPIEKYHSDGIGTPIGIRPSQTAGLIVLDDIDHWAYSIKGDNMYERYLDDIVYIARTKGEIWNFYRQLKERVEEKSLKLHTPVVRPTSKTIDHLGYRFTANGSMFWRKSDKRKWLRSRSKVTNKNRLCQLDASAKGACLHGNRYCKQLYSMITGFKFNKMGVQKGVFKRADGSLFFDVKNIQFGMLQDREVTVIKHQSDVKTSKGEGRMYVLLEIDGKQYKFCTNSTQIKGYIKMLSDHHVTKFKTVFVDNGRNHYSMDVDKTEILEVDGRKISTDDNGNAIYSDDGTSVDFLINNNNL